MPSHEILTHQLPVQDILQPLEGGANYAEYDASQKAYISSLERLGSEIPEIAERKGDLQTAGAELVSAFGVRPEFFEKHDKALLFASIAGNFAEINKRPLDNSSYDKQTYLADAAFLLTMEDSDGNEMLKQRYSKQEKADHVSDDHQEAIYKKYTDTPTTKEVIAKVDREGYLNDLAKTFNVQGTPTDQVPIHVLNIGTPLGASSFKKPENGVDYSEANEWARGLEKNAEEFSADMIDAEAKLAAGAAGFAVALNGQEQFMLPREKAEVLLAEDNGVELYDAKMKDRVIGTLRHEFTHTQGNTRLANHFGYAIEERRAEHFSGDKGEYYDVKQMFNELAILKGVHVKDLFDKVAAANREGKEASIYTELAVAYGLDTLIHLGTAMPSPYVPHLKNEFAKSIYRHGPSMKEVPAIVASTISEEEKVKAANKLVEVVTKVTQNGVSPEFAVDYYSPISNLLGINSDQLKQLIYSGQSS